MDSPEATDKELEITEHDLFVEVLFLGAFSLDRFRRQAETSSQYCRDKKKSKLLVDLTRLDATLSTVQRYELATHAVRVSAGLRVALLVMPGFVDPNKFGIMVAQNRGLTVDAFLERQKAIDWLLEKPAD